MNDIDRWFEKAAQKGNRTPSLYKSLLTDRVFTYFGYRLRFSLLLATVRFVVHVIEFFVLLTSLGGLATFTVMMLRIGGVLVGGAWWGLLEIMRERLRGFARAGERESSEQEIGRWLVLSGVVGVALVLGAGLALVHYFPSGNGRVAQLYALLIILELAIDFPVRVLHSGIFATRRVYRPIWSMFAPLVVQLAVLSVAFYVYPTAAIIISIIGSNAIGIWITVHYSIEVYRLTGLRPRFATPAYAFWRWLPKIPPWKSFTTTLSATGLRLDGVLVLGIVGVYGTDERSFDLTAAVASWSHVDSFQFFYLALPLLRGSYSGAGVFYFDFVRLRSSPALREFQLLFFRKLLCLMPIIALFFWALAAALGLFVLDDVPVSFLFALLPLFVVRSMIGTYQIRLFAEGRSGVHIATMILLTALLWLVWITPDPASDLIQITAAMTTELIVLINLQHLQDRRELALPTLLALGDWLRALGQESRPLFVGTVDIPEWATPKQKSAAVRLMQHTFDKKGHIAYRATSKVIYYQRVSDVDSEQQPQLALQATAGGTAARGRSLPGPVQNGRAALDGLVAEKWIRLIDEGMPSNTPESLSAQFRTLFPDGVVADLETLDGTREMRNIDQSLLAQALPSATQCLEDGTIMVLVSNRWLTPIFHRGTLRLLFVLPSDPEATRVRSWKTIVRGWNVSSLAPNVTVGAHSD